MIIQVGDVGTTFRVRILDQDGDAVDVSSAVGVTDKQLLFYHPDATEIAKNAAFQTDGIDGWIEYVTVIGDADLGFPVAGTIAARGEWQLRGRVVITSGTFHSEKGKFQVRQL